MIRLISNLAQLLRSLSQPRFSVVSSERGGSTGMWERKRAAHLAGPCTCTSKMAPFQAHSHVAQCPFTLYCTFHHSTSNDPNVTRNVSEFYLTAQYTKDMSNGDEYYSDAAGDAARYNQRILRKLGRALARQPDLDLSSALPPRYRSILISKKKETLTTHDGMACTLQKPR